MGHRRSCGSSDLQTSKAPPSRKEREKGRASRFPNISLKQIQGVAGIVHVVDAHFWHGDQAEQSSCSGRISGAVQEGGTDLLTVRSGYHQETIISVDSQDV